MAADGTGGGLYVSGGAVTLINETDAANSATAGIGRQRRSRRTRGQQRNGSRNPRPSRQPRLPDGRSGLYVGGGSVTLFNSTVALNSVGGPALGGGVVQTREPLPLPVRSSPATAPDDYSGAVTASNSLFQKPHLPARLAAPTSLASTPSSTPGDSRTNGGLTQTVALQDGQPRLRRRGQPGKSIDRRTRGSPPVRLSRSRHRGVPARRDPRFNGPDGDCAGPNCDPGERHIAQPLQLLSDVH